MNTDSKFFKSSSPFTPSPAVALASYFALAIWAVIVLFPLYWLFITAFKLPIAVSEGPKYLPFVDFQPSTQAFVDVFSGQGDTVYRPFINTVVVGTTSAAIAIIIGSFASYALARFNYRPKPGLIISFIGCIVLIGVLITQAGLPWQAAVPIGLAVYALISQTIGKRFFKGSMSNDDIAFWMISQRMLPPVAVIIPIYILFQQLGLLDTRVALITTYVAAHLPIVIWFMRDYFLNIPIELEESAIIDGATRYELFWYIVIPLSVPGLVSTFLIVLVFTWNEYLMALFLTGANTQTMPLLVAAQNATRGPQWWTLSVLVVTMILPIIVMAIVLERFIARGLLVGAVKG